MTMCENAKKTSLSTSDCKFCIYTRILKTFSINMKEDVGTSKPKKHANKVGRLM